MDFGALQNVVRVTPRAPIYTRARIAQLWIPGGPSTQSFKDQQLAGALMNEAEEFIDRALSLFLLRLGLRSQKHSTWADVSIYYSNYFLAGAFQRLLLSSFTHTTASSSGAASNYSIAPNPRDPFEYRVSTRQRPFNHIEMWESYYESVDSFSWIDGLPKDALLPPASRPDWRHRERRFREKRNYTPGQGFQELYQTDTRYASEIRSLGVVDVTRPREELDENQYCDRSAYDRLVFILKLLKALESSRIDPEFDVKRRQTRIKLIAKYAQTRVEERRLVGILQA